MYSELLKDARWFNFRSKILLRDGNRCRNCRSHLHLQVHHRQYFFLKSEQTFVKPWDYPLRSLVTLCKKCHDIGHLTYKIPIKYI